MRWFRAFLSGDETAIRTELERMASTGARPGSGQAWMKSLTEEQGLERVYLVDHKPLRSTGASELAHAAGVVIGGRVRVPETLLQADRKELDPIAR